MTGSKICQAQGKRLCTEREWNFACEGEEMRPYPYGWSREPKCNQDRGTRPVAFDKDAYRRRNIVERLIGWLKECRRIFSRFEKTAKNFAGMIRLAFIQRYLRIT